jgi:hypothetical protein
VAIIHYQEGKKRNKEKKKKKKKKQSYFKKEVNTNHGGLEVINFVWK